MNTEYPILMFPTATTASRSKMGGGAGKPHVPSAKANAVRLGPKFEALKSVFEYQRMHLQQEAEGMNPEDVLVLETAGRIEDFVSAVQRVEGLEWLLEEDFDGQPDEDFYDEKNKEKTLSSRLYLISTNAQALDQIISLYNQFKDSKSPGLERGYGKFKDVFEQLRDIRYWSYQDRLDGNDFLEQWLRNNEAFPENTITFQIELWYRDAKQRREAAQKTIEELVKAAGGNILGHCLIEEIRYHALLVEVKADKLREIVNNMEEGSLIKSRDIMYFKPMPQTALGIEEEDDEDADADSATVVPEDEPLPTGSPIVALLDGYPLENHALLRGRLSIEDPDGFGSQYQVKHRKHGTEMASLIIYGDLSTPGAALDTPLYVHPIMMPDKDGREQLPERMLPVDLVHRAVRRMIVGEDGVPAAAPNVKIINFSIGDSVRMFSKSASPMARLLDWLSYEFGVLFVISAGNTSVTFPIGCSVAELKRKNQQEISKVITAELLRRRMDLRLLSPAESMNNLTVGSAHQDGASVFLYPNHVNPYSGLHPTIYTPFGGGIKKAIKPELVYDGGRQILKDDPSDTNRLVPMGAPRTPGVQVAYPDDTLNKRVFERGTSSSTALITRQAYRCYKELSEVLAVNGRSESHIHLLTKALTVHGCSWETIGDNVEATLPDGMDKKEVKDIKRQWIGYGYPNFERSMVCTPQRVTVLGFGELGKEEAHVYRLPLPPLLASKTLKRRLTITLAWMSPINPQSQRYRKARLWVETTDNSKIAANKVGLVDNKASQRGTLQHEVFEGKKAHAFQDGDVLGIKVNCSEDAGGLDEKVKYAIVVSLEVAEPIQMALFGENLYEEVRNRLRVPVAITTGGI